MSTEDIAKADELLKRFVVKTQILYSSDALTYNVHQLLHVAQRVSDWGPLWSHFGYPFENNNGRLLKMIHAANGVTNQLVQNINLKQGLHMM